MQQCGILVSCFLNSNLYGDRPPRAEITWVPMSFREFQDFEVGNVGVQLWFSRRDSDSSFPECKSSGGLGPPKRKLRRNYFLEIDLFRGSDRGGEEI